MTRRKRKQFNCRCGAYGFVHRLGGGACSGIWIVERTVGTSNCQDCINNNNGCEVLRGQEAVRECPAAQDIMAYYEVKL